MAPGRGALCQNDCYLAAPEPVRLLGRTRLGEFAGFAGSTLCLQVVRVIAGLVAAHSLGPALWGQWYVLNLILAYGALSHLGALNAMSRDVPAALGRGDEAEARAITGTALTVTIVGGLVSVGLALAVYVATTSGASLRPVAVVGALLLAQQAFSFVSSNLRARNRFMAASRLQFALAGAYVVLVIGGVALFGFWGFIVGMLLAYAVSSALAWRDLSDYLRTPEWAQVRRLVTAGLPIMLVGLANALFTTVDRWVVLGRLGETDLGLYSLAIMALNAMALVPQVVSQRYYPRISYSWARDRSVTELEKLVRTQRIASQVMVLPLVAVACLVFPIVVERLLPEYVAAVPAVQISLLVPLAASFGLGHSAVLHVFDRQATYLVAVLAAAGINALLSLWLVGPLGLSGVALATLCAYAALAAMRISLGIATLRNVRSAAQGSEDRNASIVGR